MSVAIRLVPLALAALLSGCAATAAPDSSARPVVTRPVTCSTRRRPVPTIVVVWTGNARSDR